MSRYCKQKLHSRRHYRTLFRRFGSRIVDKAAFLCHEYLVDGSKKEFVYINISCSRKNLYECKEPESKPDSFSKRL